MKVRCPHQSGILHSLEFYTVRRSKGIIPSELSGGW